VLSIRLSTNPCCHHSRGFSVCPKQLANACDRDIQKNPRCRDLFLLVRQLKAILKKKGPYALCKNTEPLVTFVLGTTISEIKTTAVKKVDQSSTSKKVSVQ
jgi:hypothetical protein